jgi:hypothetical protein
MISGRSAQGGPHQRHGFKPLWPSSATAAPTRPMIYANPWELHQTGENLQVVCRGQLRNGCAKPVFDRALSRVKRPQNPYKIEHPHYRPVVVARAGAYPLGCCPSYLGVSTYLCSMPCHVPLHTPLPLHPYPVPYPRLVPRRGGRCLCPRALPLGPGPTLSGRSSGRLKPRSAPSVRHDAGRSRSDHFRESAKSMATNGISTTQTRRSTRTATARTSCTSRPPR